MRFMKLSFIIPIIFSILLGWFFGNFIYNQYSHVSEEYRNSETIYFLQQGVYSNDQVLKKNISSLDAFTTIEDDNKYYVYVGITNNYNDAIHIKKLYKEKGYDLYIKEDKSNNAFFLNDLKQYSILLQNTDDFTKVNRILKAVLASYEENVLQT